MNSLDKQKNKTAFSKNDTTFFKGIGIILIIIHNYYHLDSSFRLQNEISFNAENINKFISLISSGGFINIIGALFGFLGHYGVQIFIFFSAYGLSIQYKKWEGSDFKFIFKRLRKVYLLLAFAVLFWFISKPFTGANDNFNGIVLQLIYLVTTYSSFSREIVYSMFSGPYWFFALIIQLYILFPLLYKGVIRLLNITSWLPLALAYLAIYLLYFFTDKDTFSLFGNIIGHLPEVILAIMLIHYNSKSFKPLTIILALIVFIGSQLYEIMFPLSFLTISILILQSVQYLTKIIKGKCKNLLLFIGHISMILFIINGPLRYYSLFMYDGKIMLNKFLLFLPILFILSYFYYLLFNYTIKKLKW